MMRATVRFSLAMLLLLTCLGLSNARDFQQTEYTGKLQSELVPDLVSFSVRDVTPAAEEQLKKLKITPQPGQRAFTGTIHPRNKEMLVVLLTSPADTTLCADVDLDGSLPASECLPFSTIKNLVGPDVYGGEVILNVPVPFEYFKSIPVVVRIFKNQMNETRSRRLLYSSNAYVSGLANISGHETLVKYSLDLKTGLVDPSKGWLGVDADGDGTINTNSFSPEWANAEKETVIFRVGQHYVSTNGVNIETGEISLRAHDPKEYQRIEVQVGAELPDFSFIDFNDAPRKLSDFKDKYVLLDFWGSWCTPCKADLPYLKGAYSRYKSRGLEILGMDKDDDPAKAKLFVTENQMPWPQATTASIIDLIRFRFRISGWPSKILIDPQRRVIALDAGGKLNGEKLSEALDKLLPQN